MASGDGTASIWEPVHWREVGRIYHQAPPVAMAVSRDGKLLATALADGVVRVSFLSPTDLIAEACARLPRNLTPDEWRQYLGDERYAPTCQNLPSEEKSQAPADGRDSKPQGTR